MIYAGIGSRETPEPFCKIMRKIGRTFGSRGMILRSGNARGADESFIRGAMEVGGKMEVYLPCVGFGTIKPAQDDDRFVNIIPKGAFNIAENFHPRWNSLSDFAKRLMARNVLQVLGQDLNSPVDFVVCYTHDGLASGGTGQALRIAESYNIPIFNLNIQKDFQDLKPYIR